MTSDSTAALLSVLVGTESTQPQPMSVCAQLSPQAPLTASQLIHSAFLNTDSLQQIFHHSPVGMTVIGLDGRFMSANASFCEALGYSTSELMSLSLPEITYGDDVRLLASFNEQLLKGEREHFQIETRHWTQSGNLLYVELTVTMVCDHQAQPSCYLLQVRNLTVHKWMAEQLRHKAFYDCVTGLANRTLFMNRLEHALCRLERKPSLCCAVLFLDIDRFKMINYGLGYGVGDQLLHALGGRLSSCLREGDTLARVGSDEFAILLEEIDSLDDALKVCKRIHTHLKSGFKLADHVVLASVSIGLACSRVGYADASDLLQKADTALTQAKVQGGGYHRVFEPHQHQRAVARWHLATQAQLAVEREELSVHYQPVVNLTSGRVIGVEALARWHHPEQGEISPADFIPVLEETGAITQLGGWVLKESCAQLRQWQQQVPGTVDLKLSVNISARQLISHDLVSQVSSVLRETGLRPEDLQLEITETGIMCDAAAALKRLNALKALNVSLCIDDFGMGYSSLSRLQSFPIDILKIDRAFVSKMGANGANTEIVRSIIELGARLGMEIVAEGVETALQLAKLCGLGCDNIQGFYIAKPMPSAVAFQFIQTSHQQAAYGRRQN